MGQQVGAICSECGTHFKVSQRGGFAFHLLHCDVCGAEKSIGFKTIGQAHLAYLKGLKGPYCVASAEHDQQVRENYDGEPLTEGEYHRAVEELCGVCKCGGHFRLDAPARCPECRSVDWQVDPMGGRILYD